MMLSTLIKTNQTVIAAAWLSSALEIYPEDSRGFFGNKKDRFDNPVGRTLREELTAVLEGLAGETPPEALAEKLSGTLKIRAVQDMRPAAALAFLFAVKRVLRETLENDLAPSTHDQALAAFDARVDQAALFAFEIYAKHREKVFEVRISDVKRQVAHLLKRSAFFTNDEEAFLNEELGPIEPKPRRGKAPKRGSR
jgi:hypothetical protein